MSTRIRRHFAILAIGAIGLFATSSAVNAQVTNPGFESGLTLTGYSTIGNASVQDSTYGDGPTQGSQDALITLEQSSGSTGPNDPDTAANVATFLGLNAAQTSTLTSTFFNGSGIQQTFNVTAGQTLSLDTDFLTDELAIGGAADTAYIALSGAGITGVQLLSVGDPTLALTPTNFPDPFNSQTGFSTTTFAPFAASGNITLSLVVLNATDDTVPSALLVDNIVLTGAGGGGGGGGGAVPLPSSLLLAPLAALLAGAFGLKMRRKLA